MTTKYVYRIISKGTKTCKKAFKKKTKGRRTSSIPLEKFQKGNNVLIWF